MSFSAEVKSELCRAEIGKKCCVRAECYGLLLYCSQFSSREIRLLTESDELAARLPRLFQRAFQVEFDRRPGPGEGGKRTFSITAPDKLDTVFETFGLERMETVAHHVNFAVLEEEHCRTAFFRGAFLAGGSVTDPGKRYHLELATSHFYVSREMAALLGEAGFQPKETRRKADYITYFKQSEAIEDLLTAIGAPISAMEVMNAKAEKALRGGVNRQVNCETANLDKTVAAAAGQIEVIQRLADLGLLDELPDKLKEAVDLRVAYPDKTLSELAQLCDPPVSKSALNHRLRKIMAMERRGGAEGE